MRLPKNLDEETLKYIIARLVERADEAMQEYLNDKDNDFKNGRSLAYYEMLDILRTELDFSEQDLNEFGLDFDLEEKYLW